MGAVFCPEASVGHDVEVIYQSDVSPNIHWVQAIVRSEPKIDVHKSRAEYTVEVSGCSCEGHRVECLAGIAG